MNAWARTDMDDVGMCGSRASKHVANMWEKLETARVAVAAILIYDR